jgi:HK97 family phage major capsid protein
MSDTTTPAITPEVQAQIDAAVKAAVLAQKATNHMSGVQHAGNEERPAATEAKDLALDVSDEQAEAARWGWRVKAAFHKRAVAAGREDDSRIQALGKTLKRVQDAASKGYLKPVRKAGQYISTFEDGGLWAKETHAGEMIAFLREASLILSLPGLPTYSGYGTRMVITRQGSTASAEWVGEGKTSAPSGITYDECVLGSHKLMGKVPISGDLLRLGGAAATVGNELRTVMGETIDDACLNGKGSGKPTGLFQMTADAHKFDISGTGSQNKIDDTLKLPFALRTAKIPGAFGGSFLAPVTTHQHLAGVRGQDTYIFEEMRDLDNPKLHGKRVVSSMKLEDIGTGGESVLGYVLAQYLAFGEAAAMEVAVGESGDDFTNDMVTVRGIAYADFGMKYRKAAAWLKNVSY